MLPDALPPFPGFRTEALDFLRQLKQNNERDWFKPRKAVYDDEVLWPARCLVASLSTEGPARGLPLQGDPKKNVFRVYRDTRFSTNKAPYKTHVGLYLTRSGHKDDEGGLYVHVEPGACFLAAGFWSPEGPLLRRWRERIAADPGGLLAVVDEVETAGLTLGPGPNDPLKRMPRGYEGFAESEAALYLRWKGLIARRPVSDAAVQSPSFVDEAVAFGLDARPLLAWGWSVLDDGPPPT